MRNEAQSLWTTSRPPALADVVHMRIGLECEGGRDGNSRTSWWRRGSEVEAGLRGGGGAQRKRRGSEVEAGLRGGDGAQKWGSDVEAGQGTPSFTKGESKEIQVDKSRKTSFLSTD